MKTVIHREWWRFWRRPLFGLNPFGWRRLDEVSDPEDTYVEGVGSYKFYNADTNGDYSDDVFIYPEGGTDHGVWLRADVAPYIMEIEGLKSEIDSLKKLLQIQDSEMKIVIGRRYEIINSRAGNNGIIVTVTGYAGPPEFDATYLNMGEIWFIDKALPTSCGCKANHIGEKYLKPIDDGWEVISWEEMKGIWGAKGMHNS